MAILGVDDLDELFPFHFMVDAELRVTHMGPSLSKLAPALAESQDLPGHVQVARPADTTLSPSTLPTLCDRLVLLELKAQGALLRGQFRRWSAGGSDRWMFLGSPWVTSLGELPRLGLSLTDFATHDPVIDLVMLLQTAATSAEDARRFAQRLQHSNRELIEARERSEIAEHAKSDFVATMSHELRTPLGALVGMAELLSMTDLSEEQHHYLRVLRTNSDTLLMLINDVLDISKLKANQLVLESVAFSPLELVESCIDAFAGRAEQKGLDLALVWEGDRVEHALGDPPRLRQILSNLVGNAIKFTAKGSVLVRVSTRQADEAAWHVRFSVEDTGIGIPDDQRDNLFEPFTQSKWSSSRGYGGTGLGLHIVRSIARLMDGDVGVESAPSVGSAFHIDVALTSAQFSRSALRPRQLQRVVLVELGHATEAAVRARLDALSISTERIQKEELLALAPWGDADLIIAAHHARQHVVAHAATARAIFVMPIHAHTASASESRMDSRFHVSLVKPLRVSALERAYAQVTSGLSAGTLSGSPSLPPSASALSGRRVLLAEDSSATRLFVGRITQSAGADVTACPDGEEAYQQFLRGDPFDLVITDLDMPHRNGFELTRAIRQHEREYQLPRTPIIALSAHAMSGQRERCLREGMDNFVTKPIAAKALIDAVLYQLAGPLRVLVIDDYPDNVLMMSRLLERGIGADVLHATTGDEAVRLAQLHTVHVVFLDVELGREKGWEVASRLRALPHKDEMLIVATSGHDDGEIRARCMDAGCDSYLVRPIAHADILSVTTEARKHHALNHQPTKTFDGEAAFQPTSDILDLVPSYVANRHKDLQTLENALNAQDFAKIQRIGHNIKGSAASYGMVPLGRLGTQLESLSERHDRHGIHDVIQAIRSFLAALDIAPRLAQSSSRQPPAS